MKITATSQTSRFNTVDNKLNSIDIKNVCISTDTKELLVDTNIQLNSGIHYGLIGRNGTGKSVLLKCIASGKLLSPALRGQLKVMYVTQSLDDIAGKDDRTVLDEIKTPPFGYNFYQSQIEKYRLLTEQVSGERGKRAREMLQKLEQEGSQDDENLDVVDSEEITFNEIKPVIDQLKLGKSLEKNYEALSGGWKMRIQLAKALVYQPDLLLLDEPTNHLDISGVRWLEGLVKGLEITTLIVSHNREFLNNTVTEIIWLKNKRLEFFKGNYNTFLQTIEEKQLHAAKFQSALAKKKEKAEASIQQSLKSANKHGDDKKLKQVASRKTKLEERMGYERNAKGHRFKLNRDRVGYFDSKYGDVKTVDEEQSQKLGFKMEATLPRGTLLIMDDVSFERKIGDNVFRLKGITFNVEPCERIAILGSNGQGKSTVLNLATRKIIASSGAVNINTANFGYFEQDIVTQLGKETKTPIERLSEIYAEEKQLLWNHLGSFGLGKLADTSLCDLSGGQRVAYAFAELSFKKPALLLLDEPNSHLDLDAIEALEDALNEYEGGVVFVSHDISFVKDVATSAYWINKGKMKKMDSLDDLDTLITPTMAK